MHPEGTPYTGNPISESTTKCAVRLSFSMCPNGEVRPESESCVAGTFTAAVSGGCRDTETWERRDGITSDVGGRREK